MTITQMTDLVLEASTRHGVPMTRAAASDIVYAVLTGTCSFASVPPGQVAQTQRERYERWEIGRNGWDASDEATREDI